MSIKSGDPRGGEGGICEYTLSYFKFKFSIELTLPSHLEKHITVSQFLLLLLLIFCIFSFFKNHFLQGKWYLCDYDQKFLGFQQIFISKKLVFPLTNLVNLRGIQLFRLSGVQETKERMYNRARNLEYEPLRRRKQLQRMSAISSFSFLIKNLIFLKSIRFLNKS